mgnify:CR=1 FL=1
MRRLILIVLLILFSNTTYSFEMDSLVSLTNNREIIPGNERSYISKRCVSALTLMELVNKNNSMSLVAELWLNNLNFIENNVYISGQTDLEIQKVINEITENYMHIINREISNKGKITMDGFFIKDVLVCEALADPKLKFLEKYNQ